MQGASTAEAMFEQLPEYFQVTTDPIEYTTSHLYAKLDEHHLFSIKFAPKIEIVAKAQLRALIAKTLDRSDSNIQWSSCKTGRTA